MSAKLVSSRGGLQQLVAAAGLGRRKAPALTTHVTSRAPVCSLTTPKTQPTVSQHTRGLHTSIARRSGAAGVSRTATGVTGVTSTPLPEITDVYPNIASHKELYEFSIHHPDEFWGRLARSRLQWEKEFSIISDHDMTNAIFKWFPDGVLNASVNCVDRHAKEDPDRVALLWEKDEPGQEERVTYRELQELVCRTANVLLDLGVKKGDRVAIYMPVGPKAVAAMLACTRIGAIHSVVFAGFSAEALASRINDAGAEVVITMDEAVRGGKTIPLKKVVDAAAQHCPSLRHVLMGVRTGAEVSMGPKDINLDEALQNAAPYCEPTSMASEDLLFLLYTSGSTGKPKGVAHSTAGYLLYAAVTHKQVFDYHVGDVFGCMADIGWITGHSYVVYGPLANGATTLLFESTPTYPDPGRYWETVERLRINQLYCAPTALRLLLRYGDEYVTKYDRSSLKVLGSVGEPLNHEPWVWYNNIIGEGRCPLVDTWWQTETGGIMLSPRPSAPEALIKPAKPMRPMFGVAPILKDANNVDVCGNNADGALCIQSLWPGAARTVYGDHNRFLDTYWRPYPGTYFTGDGAHRRRSDKYLLYKRLDEVLPFEKHGLTPARATGNCKTPVVTECSCCSFSRDISSGNIFDYDIMSEPQVEGVPHWLIFIVEKEMVVGTILQSYCNWRSARCSVLTRFRRLLGRRCLKIIKHERINRSCSLLNQADIFSIILFKTLNL
ncbi:unnamed protein product, partial [Meganyctiphanes norvegica]